VLRVLSGTKAETNLGRGGPLLMRRRKRILSSTVTILVSLLGTLLGLSALYFGYGIDVAHADSVIATIPVRNGPIGIAFDAANSNLYVTNEGDNSVSVISGQTNTVIGTPIHVGNLPSGIAFDFYNGGLYVANFPDTVSVISGQTNTVIGTPIPVGNGPIGIAFDPLVLGHPSVFGSLYVTNVYDDTVSVISGQTNTVIGTPIPVGHFPGGIAFDSANGNLYVANGGSATISVISGQNNQVIGTIAGPGDGTSVGGIAFDSANGNLYVANSNTDTVSVISGQTNTVIGTPIPVGDGPDSIAFDSANGNLYVTNYFDNTVSVISGQTNSVIGTPIPVGYAPRGIAFDSANGNLYVANNHGNTVSVIATSGSTQLTLNTIPDVPWHTKVTVTGKLTDTPNGGTGLGAKTITFTSPNGSPLPASVLTKSGGTYSATFTSSNTISPGWLLQAHYAGDSLHHPSASLVRSYNTVKHATTLTLSVPLKIPFGTKAIVTGKLADSSAAGIGVASRTITFTTSNGSPLPASVITASDGSYKATFKASNTIFSGWNIQAHFAGGGRYNAASSSVHTYNTVKHITSLTLVISPTSVAAGGTYSVSGTLGDHSAAVPLASKTITFTSTSPITINPATTTSTGQYSVSGLTAPTTAGTYSIRAHFAGDARYNVANSQTHTLTVH
jgi:YVTN family beta-propeller protein